MWSLAQKAMVRALVVVSGRALRVHRGVRFSRPRAVLVTLGAAGSFFKDAGRRLRVPAFAVEAVDPTAAGDAYIGSLAVSLAAGLLIDAAMLRASAVAALAVTRHGAQDSLPAAAEVEAFLAAHAAGAGTPGA
jgi:ribokinase